MARINIEECWWSDPRRTALLLEIGFEADSAAVNMWRAAQEFWGKSRGLIPKSVFDKLKHCEKLVEVGLADVRESFVYVRGCSEYLEWHAEKREQAAAAGRKSAEVRRKKSGSAQPKGGKGHEKSERERNDIRTDANGTEPSDSGSLSGSGLNSKNTYSPFREFSNLYRAKFPSTTLGQNAEERFKRQIKTLPDHEHLRAAIEHYATFLAHPKNSWRSPKASFETFLGAKGFWRDFIHPPNVADHPKNGKGDWEDSAKLVLAGLKKFGPDESTGLQKFLGGLYDVARKVPGGISGLRQSPLNDFTIPRMAGLLKEASERAMA